MNVFDDDVLPRYLTEGDVLTQGVVCRGKCSPIHTINK